MITAAAITGRSSRNLLILRAGPRSVASTVASTTPLTIMASVSSESISCSFEWVSLATPHSLIALMSASEHGLVPGMRMTGTLLVPGGTRTGSRVSPGSARGLTCRCRAPADTGGMPRTVNWLARTLGYVWLGLLAFLVAPPNAPFALPAQIAGYVLLGFALLAWTVIEAYRSAPAARIWHLGAARGPRGDGRRRGVRVRRRRRRHGHGGLRVRGRDGRGRQQRPRGGPGRDRSGHTRDRGQRAGFRRQVSARCSGSRRSCCPA